MRHHISPEPSHATMPALADSFSYDVTQPNGNAHSIAEMRSLEQLLDVSTKVLAQAIDLLDNSLTSDDQLTVSSKYLPGSTIGDYRVFLSGMTP